MQLIDVLLTDPPWWYANRKTGGERCNKTKFGGGASKHYDLMRDKDLLALADSVRAVMADNSACFMWATMPRLDFGIDLLKAWGFRYVTTAFTWIKTSPNSGQPIYGPGSYTASNPEIVLLGIRGSMPVARQMMPSVIHYPRGEHSAKPPIHQLIDELYPGGVKVEMFARRPAPGWICTGNQLTGQDIAQALPVIGTAPAKAIQHQQMKLI